LRSQYAYHVHKTSIITNINFSGGIAGTLTVLFSRNPVGGATAKAWQEGSIAATTTTDVVDSTYLFPDLNIGLYDVEFITEGYYDSTEMNMRYLQIKPIF
jgi:hypothetical protein